MTIDTSDEAIENDWRTAEQAGSDRLMNLALQRAQVRVALRGLGPALPAAPKPDGDDIDVPGPAGTNDVRVLQRPGDDVYIVPHGAATEDRVEVANLILGQDSEYGLWVVKNDAPVEVRWDIGRRLIGVPETTTLYEVPADATWAYRVDLASRVLGIAYDDLLAQVDPDAPAAIDGTPIEDGEPVVEVRAEDPAEHSQYADDENAGPVVSDERDVDLWEQARRDRES